MIFFALNFMFSFEEERRSWMLWDYNDQTNSDQINIDANIC